MTALTNADADARLASLKGWERWGTEIRKTYTFDKFGASMTFANRVAGLAEEMDHHPDILIQYSKVSLTLSSHDAGGLTDRDFTLAARIDA